jgi:wyosine [tRNA(Phe)-imidazoG37] synthetase (radical SAM superfamily)
MPYVFGPVPSRRLGLSLGIDLIPAKTCTYDCLYCQVGRTTKKTVESRPFVPVSEVLEELNQRLEKIRPDVITLSGSGEPTLHSGIGQVIKLIKRVTDIQVALLTNGSLLWKGGIRNRVCGAHIILPTLSTVFEKTFMAIHRPHSELNLSAIIEGFKSLRRMYRGLLFLEVVILPGFNDSDREVEGLKKVIDQIFPDKIQLNTAVRPPADSRARSLDRERLEAIKDFFGEKAEIVAAVPLGRKGSPSDMLAINVLEMARRRPLRAADLSSALNMSLEDVESLIKGLLIKGHLRRQEHSGEVYYLHR